jgi:hypothetical protein
MEQLRWSLSPALILLDTGCPGRCNAALIEQVCAVGSATSPIVLMTTAPLLVYHHSVTLGLRPGAQLGMPAEHTAHHNAPDYESGALWWAVCH